MTVESKSVWWFKCDLCGHEATQDQQQPPLAWVVFDPQTHLCGGCVKKIGRVLCGGTFKMGGNISCD